MTGRSFQSAGVPIKFPQGMKATAFMVLFLFQIALVQASSPSDYNQLVSDLRSGDISRFRYALAKHPVGDINLAGRSLLMAIAIESAHADAVDALLNWGMNVNRYLLLSSQGVPMEITPLMHAISAKASPEVVKRLLILGADPNIPSEGLFPLNLALGSGQFEIARLLLDSGAHPSPAEAEGGMTPLMELAMAARDPDDIVPIILARRIVSAGGKIDSRSMQGGAALSFAVIVGNHLMARTLLELGANPNWKNAKGETPLAIANRLQREDLSDLLKPFGAHF